MKCGYKVAKSFRGSKGQPLIPLHQSAIPQCTDAPTLKSSRHLHLWTFCYAVLSSSDTTETAPTTANLKFALHAQRDYLTTVQSSIFSPIMDTPKSHRSPSSSLSPKLPSTRAQRRGLRTTNACEACKKRKTRVCSLVSRELV